MTGRPGADPGLAGERTTLAWQRTGVTGVAVAGSALVTAAHFGTPWTVRVAALATALCALAVGVALSGPVRWRLAAVAAIPVLLAPSGVALALTR